MPDPPAGPMRISILWLSCGIALSPFGSSEDPEEAVDGREDWKAEASNETHGKEVRIRFEGLLMPSLHTIEESGILCIAFSI
jgi:hypothetical protein